MCYYVANEGERDMPTCGRVIAFGETLGSVDWRFSVKVAPGTLRNNFLSLLQLWFPRSVNAVEGDKWDEITLVTSDMGQRESVLRALRLLNHAVTIDDDADVSHALAIHRYGDIGQRSYVGNLVYQAKYTPHPFLHESELGRLMLTFFLAHTPYRGATHITSPPSHDGSPWSGTAGKLATRIGANENLLPMNVISSPRNPRKNAEHPGDCSEILGTFQAKERLDGAIVLVIDDLYGAGCTLTEMARVLRAAGASKVLSLSGSKTAKGCRGLRPKSENWPDWSPTEVLG